MNARAIAVALGLLSFAGGVLLELRLPRFWPFALELVVLGGLIVASTFFERRYRQIATSRRPGFEPTGEAFVDPTSGVTIDVDENPSTGERSYRRR